MSEPHRPRSRFKALLAVAASALSLALLGVASGSVANAGESSPDMSALARPASGRIAVQPLQEAASAAPTAAPEQVDRAHGSTEGRIEVVAPVVAMVAVPDVSGLRLWIARKRLADAGLKMIPREDRRLVPTDEYPEYQVERVAEFGQQVPAGSAVTVGVEYWEPRFAQGY